MLLVQYSSEAKDSRELATKARVGFTTASYDCHIQIVLNEIQNNLFTKALNFREEHITEVDNFEAIAVIDSFLLVIRASKCGFIGS